MLSRQNPPRPLVAKIELLAALSTSIRIAKNLEVGSRSF